MDEKQTTSSNVRQKMQNWEDGGLRLLKKGKRGIIRVIFGRTGLVVLLFLLQVLVLLGVFRWFEALIPHLFGGAALFTACMVIYLLNSDNTDNSAKITWLVVIALVPVLGVLLFWWVKSDTGHRVLKRRVAELSEQTRGDLPQPPEALDALEETHPDAVGLARYLRGKGGGFPVYQNTALTYFPSGEAKFAELLYRLEQADKYIFLEYFIIDEGLMWGRILEILARKAAEGLDVRVMYDGTCEFTNLPRDYPQRLAKLNIQCKVFSPLMPFVSTHYNYRDHRKIVVVDGKVGFTGGVNLADEYINAVEKYGRWKDAALMLEGEAVRSLTAEFLQMWGIAQEPEFAHFLTQPIPAPEHPAGFAAPYGDCPLDEERVGELVYIDLLNRARNYIHIMTPYLILDGELETALKFAAERGVDVHLILPGVPDKKFPYALAKTHYKSLLKSGVKISEWVPGFVHAKVFVVDGREAVVGTINLDYRSLYHHFEDAVWLADAPCIASIEEDFQRTLAQCRAVAPTPKSIWQGKVFLRLAGMLLKAIAPLL